MSLINLKSKKEPQHLNNKTNIINKTLLAENIEKKNASTTIKDNTQGNSPKKEVKNSDVTIDENTAENKVESKDKSVQKKPNKSEKEDLTKKKEKE